MAKERAHDDDREDEIDDDFEGGGGDDDVDGDFGDSDVELDDEDVAHEDGDFDEDGDDEVVARAPVKRRAPARSVPQIEGVAKTKLEKPDICAEVWEKVGRKYENEKGVPYSIRMKLNREDRVVEHNVFGTGYVIEIESPTRVEVLFKDALRKLVFNR
jgi:hypothetical protein